MTTTIDYTITDDITKCTHWLSAKDDNSVVKEWIIPNKFYKIYRLKDELTNEDEFYIISEDKNYSMYYLCYDGNYVIRK